MKPLRSASISFAELFAGAGMARLGFGADWKCAFANDMDPMKAAAYRQNFGADQLRVCDVARITSEQLPTADLVWMSPPCQDLSLAGARKGLAGERSGAFWPAWCLIDTLQAESRAPRVVVVENVVGLLTSNDGTDFTAIVEALASGGYCVGAVVIDAALFVPQSRQRLFIVAASGDMAPAAGAEPSAPFHPPALIKAIADFPQWARNAWRWWRLPEPPLRSTTLADVLEPDDPATRRAEELDAARHIAMMAPPHLAKLKAMRGTRHRMVAAGFRRTRDGVQRFEIRDDGICGALRTASGGSSRQQLLIVEGVSVRLRLMAPREAARCMGIPDGYVLPANVNEALTLIGDGVAPPVVRFLSEKLLAPEEALEAA